MLAQNGRKPILKANAINYVMSVKVANESAIKVSLDRSKVVSNNGNDSFSPRSPKVLTIGFIEDPKNFKLE